MAIATLMTYAEAMQDVQQRVTKSRSSFLSGMSILPQERREAMYALYAFCRDVDDIADDSATSEIAAKGLADWRVRIKDLFKGQSSNSITVALQPAVQMYGLVEADFQSIIDGMEMDAVEICAPDEATFDSYLDRVASAVGRVSVRIFGDASANGMKVAHHLGRALQTTNILRDLAEDAMRHRLYLPHELLTKHGIKSRNPAEVVRDIRIPEVCRDMAARAKEHFKEADKAMNLCAPASMRPAKVMRAYYAAILDRLIVADWQDVMTRVSLPAWQKIWLILRYGVF
jgi:presqualene diphosphate synthase